MSHSSSQPAVALRTSAVVAVTLSALMTFGGCSNDKASTASTAPESVVTVTSTAASSVASLTAESTTVDTAPVASATADFSAYCEQVLAFEGDRTEAYVGSTEHRADVESLVEVAPEAVIGPLRIFSAFLASDATVSGDPDSNVVENWPRAVQAAIGEIAAYNDTTC